MQNSVNKVNLEQNRSNSFTEQYGCNAQFVSRDPGYNWNAGKISQEVYTLLLSAVNSDIPLLMVGPTGQGKTLAAYAIAHALSREDASEEEPVKHRKPVPIVRYQCSKESGHYDMCGHESIVENGIVRFVPGDLARCIEMTNDVGLSILLIDELNALPPEGQKALNPLLEPERRILIGEREWVLEEGKRIAIVATMNPNFPGYGGTKELNLDLESRFPHKVYIGYPDNEEEMEILVAETNDKKIREQLILLANHTRNNGENSMHLSAPLSTRDLTNFLRAYKRDSELFDESNREEVLRMQLRSVILSKYWKCTTEQRESISKKINDVFGISPD